jgi:hypothetical protein
VWRAGNTFAGFLFALPRQARIIVTQPSVLKNKF